MANHTPEYPGPDGHPEIVRRPSWLSIMNLGAGLQVVVLLAGVMFWVVAKADKTDQTAVALMSVSARLDAIVTKLDALPVLSEQVSQLRLDMTGTKGAYASLEARLRAIEASVAAANAEARRP